MHFSCRADLDSCAREGSQESAGGLQKPYKCSTALTKFLGGDKTVSRATLLKDVVVLQGEEPHGPENKRWIIADEACPTSSASIASRASTVSKYLSPHLLPME